jgi:hypothetical protein
MLGAILADSSPPPYKEMTDKTDEPAPKKVPYLGDGGEVEFGQPKEVEADEGEEEEKMAEEFGLRFAKWWPFRLLKTLNLVSGSELALALLLKIAGGIKILNYSKSPRTLVSISIYLGVQNKILEKL